MTMAAQDDRVRACFGVSEVVFAGDRGMLTQARIETLKGIVLSWILALRSEHARKREELLARVEQPFRSLKSVDLAVRPIRHRLAHRVRAHVFICMLAYHVRWHLERAWAPLLFRDEEPPLSHDPVAPARRSAGAPTKTRTGRREDGGPRLVGRELRI